MTNPFDIIRLVPVPGLIVIVLAVAVIVGIVIGVGNHDQ